MKVAKKVAVAGLVLASLLIVTPYVFAQGGAGAPGAGALPQSVFFTGGGLGACLGMGITLIGAGLGLGKIGSAGVEAMARQPEVAAKIQTAMIIVAAMLEGASLASVVLCFVIGGQARF
jgi:F-type H+-transporting ATPase subunit c